MILIFHLCLSQGRLAGGAPVDRFLPLVNRTVQKKLSELPHNRRLVFKIHGEIGILPLPKDPKSFEFLSLNLHKFGCIIPASLPDLNDRELSFFHTEALLHLMLNGQSMTIPSWNIMAIKPRHELRFHDEVLQDFIQGCPDVNVSIGIGRTIMKNIFGSSFCLLTQLVINPFVSHSFRISGSLLARLAFMGKSVLGRLSV